MKSEGWPAAWPALAGILIGGAIAVSLVKAFWLTAPKPGMVAAAQLTLPGYRSEETDNKPGQSNRRSSVGISRHFRLYPSSGGVSSRMILTPMRMREIFLLPGLRIMEPDLDQNLVTQKVLQLTDGDEIAISQFSGRGGRITRLETCLTPSGLARFAPSGSLGRALQAERDEEWTNAPFQTLLSRNLGIDVNARWECLAVLIEQPTQQQSPQELIGIWKSAKGRIAQ